MTTIKQENVMGGNRDAFAEIPDEEAAELLHGKVLEKHVYICDRGRKLQQSVRKQRNPYATKKVGCPCEMHVVRFSQSPDQWYIFQTHDHEGHGNNDPRYEPLSQKLQELCGNQILFGGTSGKIVAALRENRERFGLTEDELQTVTPLKIERLKQKMNRIDLLDENERVSVKKMKEIPEFHIIFLLEEKDLYALGICTEFQAAMLGKCGDFVFLDSVHSVTKHGLFQLTILVLDETGKGIPVGFCLTNTENATVWKHFILATFQKAGRDASASVFMSDNCGKIKLAVSRVGATRHLLCWFHLMQAVDRKLNSLCRGPNKREVCQRIKNKIRDLQRLKDKNTFEIRVQHFYEWLECDERVKECMSMTITYAVSGGTVTANTHFRYYFDQVWIQRGACDMWVAYGRVDENMNPIAWHGHNTNNVIENYFNQQKYRFSRARRTVRLDQHVRLLVTKVNANFVADRQQMLQGIVSTRKQIQSQNVDLYVSWLKDGHCIISQPSIGLGVADAQFGDDSDMFCLSDLSCTCQKNPGIICPHLEAAASMFGITSDAIKSCAAIIKEQNMMSPLPGTGETYQCIPFAKKFGKSLWAKRKYYVTNGTHGSEWCECGVFSRARTCPHILALGIGEDRIVSLEELFPGEDVCAHRPSMSLCGALSENDDPAFKYHKECLAIERQKTNEPFYKQRVEKLIKFFKTLTEEDADVLDRHLDEFLDNLDNELCPVIRSGWTPNDVSTSKSRSRSSKDRIEKPLFPDRYSRASSKRSRGEESCDE